MATRIKVTLDTDQWEAVRKRLGNNPDHALKQIDPLGWIGRQRTEEIWKAIDLARRGTGEGVPCGCEEWGE